MKRTFFVFCIQALLILVGATSNSLAQSSQTFYVKAKLSPDNEVPAISGLNALGSGRVKITVNKDSSGAITSGVATFDVAFQFPGAVTLVGCHIHSAAVGENGNVVISSDLSATTYPDGKGSFSLTTPTLNSTAQIAALNGLITTPHLYYLNVHTSDNQGGAMRGQLTTETHFFKGYMLPGNQVPPLTDLNARASASVTLDVTRDSSGNITSGAVMFDVNYQFPPNITFVGLHIHSAGTGENGSVIIDSGLPSFTDPTGVGKITRIVSLPTSEAILSNLKAIIADPQRFYVNLHTSDNPAGAVRAQLNDANQLSSIPYSVDDAAFRSNLGIQNLTNIPGQVLAQVSGKDGDLYEKVISVSARGFVQLLNVNPSVGNEESEGAIKIHADQHVEAFVTMIENTTNFPNVIPLAASGYRLAIASVTNVGRFKSSLVVFNEGTGAANVELTARDRSGAVSGQKTITIEAGSMFTDPDILTAIGVASGYGPLEIRSTNGQPLSAMSRVYSVSDNRGSVFMGKEF